MGTRGPRYDPVLLWLTRIPSPLDPLLGSPSLRDICRIGRVVGSLPKDPLGDGWRWAPSNRSIDPPR